LDIGIVPTGKKLFEGEVSLLIKRQGDFYFCPLNISIHSFVLIIKSREIITYDGIK